MRVREDFGVEPSQTRYSRGGHIELYDGQHRPLDGQMGLIWERDEWFDGG